MLINYFKIAIRNLYKHKSFTLINLFGLVTGLSSALVLALIAYQQLNFDSVHEKSERIHLIYKERTTPSSTQLVYDTWVPTLEVMKETYPEIETGTRYYTQPAFIKMGTDRFEEVITFADASLFNMFSITTHNGDGFKQLSVKSNILLSQETAERFFGDKDAVGKLVNLQIGGVDFDFTVAGILNDLPVNSSVRPTMLVSFENALDLEYVRNAGWDNSFIETYVLLNPQTDIVKLEAQFFTFVRKVFDEEVATRMKLKLVSLVNYHDQLTNSNRMAYIMLCIALMIITVAVINYINLVTVRSIERAKEIGLRKVMGATSFGLARQFLGESFVLTALAIVLAALVVHVAMPFLNSLLDITISLNMFTQPVVLLTALLLLIFIAITSGSFPALFVARHKLTESVRGKVKTSNLGVLLRKGLIVFQFSLAVMLLLGTVVIYKQVDFMKNFNTGTRKSQVVVVPTDTDNIIDSEAARTKIVGLKKGLLQHSAITHVASSNIVPSDNSRGGYTMIRPDGWMEAQPFRILRVYVDESYFDLYDVKFLDGEKFSDRMTAADTLVHNFAIINEAAMHAFGWQSIDGMKTSPRTQIVGLVADHHYTNLGQSIEPMIFVYRPTEEQASSFLSVRFTGGSKEAINIIKSKWETLNTSRPFTYFFIDKNFERLYEAEDRSIKIITWFSILTIVIACLGLLGLISFTIEQKTKEIGIRKVLGSSIVQILFLLNREFIVLITISLAIALPLATLILVRWLQDFAVRVSIHWSWFMSVVFVAFVMSFVVTGIKAWQAAVINPVKSLKSE